MSTTTAADETLIPLDLLDERTRRALSLRRERSVRQRGWLVRRALVGADLLGMAVATMASAITTHGPAWFASLEASRELAGVLVLLPAWIVIGKAAGLYDRDDRFAEYSTTGDIGPVFNIVTPAVLAYALAWQWLGFASPSHLRTIVFWAISIPAVTVARAGARALVRRRPEYLQNTVIVGAGDVGQALARKFMHRREAGVNVVGFIDAQPRERQEGLEHLALLGEKSDLPRLVRLLDIDRVVIAFSNDSSTEVLELVRELRDLNVLVDIVPRLFDLIGPGVEMHTVEGMPLVGLATLRLPRSSLVLKRGLDLLIAVVALTLLAPLFLLIALATLLDSGGPILFRQKRMGANGVPFDVLKFRTMVQDAEGRKHEVAHLNRHLRDGGDPRMFKIENDPRVTHIGRVLRRYFLDELPQLLNVLRGEMSVIGPRPLILEEASHVDTWGRRRLELKPGMTGPWQVLGRSSIGFAEMVKLDYFYVTTWSLAGDLRLLLQTIPLVFRGEAPV